MSLNHNTASSTMLRVCIFLLLQAHLGTCGTRWPVGSYGLLKPISGCPRGFDHGGFVFQDTVDTNPSNDRSAVLHIDGYISKGEVLRYFCTNPAVGSSDTTAKWPQGQYCIYRNEGSEFEGMDSGSIRMYDEENDNQDAFKIDHDFVKTKWSITWKYEYTKFYFACQTSGNKNTPISLPITKPFYLLPYGSRDCQQVEWMVATTEWIKYHTRGNSDAKHDTVPHVDLGNTDSDGVTMYYCYYQSCNYTLIDTSGVFQSPGFPGKYPDGQLCSWRIMVPDNHTVRVSFTNFSLNGSNVDDYLRSFMKINGTYLLNKTFYGVKQPFSITASSEVKFLFRSNEESNSYGFRAEYHVFTQQGTTTPQTIPSKNTIHSTMQASVKPTSGNCSSANSVPKKSHSLGQTRTITAILIPLAFVAIGFLLFIVILYRCRSKQRRCDPRDARESKLLKEHNATEARRCTSFSRDMQEDESPDNLKHEERSTSHTDIDPEYHVLEPISNGVPDNDGQMYQTLSRDQPEYEAPNYSKNTTVPDVDLGAPEYHVLEPMNNNVPDVVYHVLEGPDSNDRPTDDRMYQALDKETTHNNLYQSTTPATMITQNPLYV